MPEISCELRPSRRQGLREGPQSAWKRVNPEPVRCTLCRTRHRPKTNILLFFFYLLDPAMRLFVQLVAPGRRKATPDRTAKKSNRSWIVNSIGWVTIQHNPKVCLLSSLGPWATPEAPQRKLKHAGTLTDAPEILYVIHDKRACPTMKTTPPNLQVNVTQMLSADLEKNSTTSGFLFQEASPSTSITRNSGTEGCNAGRATKGTVSRRAGSLAPHCARAYSI